MENLFGTNHKVKEYGNERPRGLVDPVAVSTRGLVLPSWTPTGWRLDAYEEGNHGQAAGNDPFVIHGRWGDTLYQWPEGYVPSPTEINEVCSDLIGKRHG